MFSSSWRYLGRRSIYSLVMSDFLCYFWCLLLISGRNNFYGFTDFEEKV